MIVIFAYILTICSAIYAEKQNGNSEAFRYGSSALRSDFGLGLPRNCHELINQDKMSSGSGVYTVYPYSCCPNRPVTVYCDQNTDKGGWTVIQKRNALPKRKNFYRKWTEYKLGFGQLTGEFWLGLENIHALVNEQLMELRIDLEDFEGNTRWAKYEYFHVGSEDTKYVLDLGSYSGNAGDALTYHSGKKFSTKDQDNDINPISCAKAYKGGWWYGSCHVANLNGLPFEGKHKSYANGINWHSWRGYHYSLKMTQMSIRPVLN